METNDALVVFAALSQETRLQAFRLIVKHGPDGLPAGEIAASLNVPQNTMSSHLAILSGAGLVSAERRGRSILYRAEIERVRALASFLVSDCCDGRPELCMPLAAEFTSGCKPEEKACAC